MKLSEIREAYEEFSGKLSRFCCQLSLMSIAFVALLILLGAECFGGIKELKVVLALFICSILLHTLQYLYQSIVWYIYYWNKSSGGKSEDMQINEPEWINIVPWLLFIAKALVFIWALAKLCMIITYL